tara:strand:- start:113 stop:292 length:180 start_codon:yes stop_codon:yes gene_type:complete
MEKGMMIEELKKQEEELRADLIDLEKQFNTKKERYLKVQGAMEALNLVGNENKDNEKES